MIRRIVTWNAAFAGLAFTVILTNQVLQLSQFAASIHPTAGQVVFWLLLTVMAAGLAVPLILIIRLPPALIPPEEESGPEFDAHLAVLQRRLGTNVITRGRPLGSREDVEATLAVLDEVASEKIEKTARRAFMATAISQNGALDAVVVFGLQARLVWDVAAVYSQRPSWRELTYLRSGRTTLLPGHGQVAHLACPHSTLRAEGDLLTEIGADRRVVCFTDRDLPNPQPPGAGHAGFLPARADAHRYDRGSGRQSCARQRW